jgi:uncharacterized protein YecE (DUF72 family)
MSPQRTVRPGTVRIGLSGWTYKSWRGRFYPKGLPHKRELAYIGSVFSTVEINGTFYSMQQPDTFGRWAEATPDDFVFAVKGPRFLTHMKRLNEPVAPLANFIASGLLRQAGAGPLAAAAQFPLRSGEARRFLHAAAARHDSRRRLRTPSRSPPQSTCLVALQSAAPAAPRPRSPS